MMKAVRVVNRMCIALGLDECFRLFLDLRQTLKMPGLSFLIFFHYRKIREPFFHCKVFKKITAGQNAFGTVDFYWKTLSLSCELCVGVCIPNSANIAQCLA